jgi:glycosyltransferase involved in cell wall biosynthesis
MTELSIIVPCRNDAKTLCTTLDELQNVVVQHSMSVETLIIDDQSDDDTLGVATKSAHQFPPLHIRVLIRKRLQRGLGGVLRYGMAFARGRYCVLLLPDGQDPIELIPQFLFHLRTGKHLVQTSPRLPKSGLFRIGQTAYLEAARLIMGNKLTDTTSMFRGFDRVFVQAIGLTSQSYDVGPEMTFKVSLCGGQIEYLPSKQRRSRTGKPHSFRPRVQPWGYVWLLVRAALHKMGLLRWF